jgi:hypothetical protein
VLWRVPVFFDAPAANIHIGNKSQLNITLFSGRGVSILPEMG